MRRIKLSIGKSNRIRSRVEHVFGVIKNLWGYRKVRYKGIREEQSTSIIAVSAG